VPVTFLSNVMGHANVGVTQSVYVHLYGREDAEDAFRSAAVANLSVRHIDSEKARYGGPSLWSVIGQKHPAATVIHNSRKLRIRL
jgi:hypothetical protein